METLCRRKLQHIYVLLMGAIPVAYHADSGKLEVALASDTMCQVFALRGHEAALSQAIYEITGMHCGVLPVVQDVGEEVAE